MPPAVLAQALAGAVVLEAVGLDREPQVLAAEVDDGVQPGLGDLQLRGEVEALLDGQRAKHRLERVGRPCRPAWAATRRAGSRTGAAQARQRRRRAPAIDVARSQGGVGDGQRLVEREGPGAVEHRAQRAS